MEPNLLVGLIIGLAIGAGFAALLLRGRAARELERGRTEVQAQVAALQATLAERDRLIESQRTDAAEQVVRAEQRAAELQRALVQKAEIEMELAKEREAWVEKLALLNEAQAKLADAFKSLSADALKSNNQQFLDLAKTHLEKFQESARVDLDTRQKSIGDLVTPVQQSLEKVDNRIQELEKARVGAYESLQQQVKGLLDTQLQLRNETGNLVKALRQPVVRGRWGEIQLRRVAELAGMVNYCDFYEQQSASTEDGLLRPDMLVRLPGGKTIVVDAKAPLEAYLTSLEAPDDATRLARLVDHARQVRNHIGKLSQKRYWEQFKPTPEFVVLFLPGETFFAAALEQDPQLIEVGVESQVIVATPTTLIALLRAVSYGWRQEHIAENAQAISRLGRDLYERIAKLAEHWTRLGKSLDGAVDNYNKATGSLETRVLVAARRFRELDQGISAESIDDVSPVEAITREVQSEELLKLPGAPDQPSEGLGEAEKH